MHKENPALNMFISAAFITASYFYLSYGVFIAAEYLSLASVLLSAKEIVDFFYILAGVAFDRLVQKLSLRDRLITLACLVIIPALIFKFFV